MNILSELIGSTLDIGSSNKYISASLYIALAKLILAFWPPEIFCPLDEISVISPPGNRVKSEINWHISKTFLYLSIFNSL